MRLRMFVALSTALLALPALATQAPASASKNASPAALQAFTADDLVRLKRLTDPQVSPDGRYVTFVLRETDMEANKGRTHIWLQDLTQRDQPPRRLTQSEANDSSPRWAPDSRTLYFISTRSGNAQIWRLSMSGGEAARVTDYPLDIGLVEGFAGRQTRDSVVFTWANLSAPADLYSVRDNGNGLHRMTQVNAELLGRRRMSEFEQFTFKGWNDETVYGYVMKPFGYQGGLGWQTAGRSTEGSCGRDRTL